MTHTEPLFVLYVLAMVFVPLVFVAALMAASNLDDDTMTLPDSSLDP